MSSPNRTMKLPRLRTKEELLKTSPELFGKLLLGDEMSTARSTTAPASATHQPSKSLRPVQSAGRTSMGRTPSRAGQLGATYDTPRGFGDEPMPVDQELAIELESVKRERQQLMDSIAQVKAEAGTAGGEAQQADITQLLKELELKKAKLNELRGESRKAEADIARCRDDDTDAQRLTPDGCVVENNYIQGLHDEMATVDEDLLEADAKNRLYQLLGERTRQEHMALDQKVRDKQDSLRACMEDLASLTDHYNSVRAAKELAQKELAKTKRQVEEARHDWTRKIRERRAEVNELQRRQRKEHEKEVKRREKLQEKEKAEHAAQAKLKMEEEAYQLQVAALAPKIEAMEASWNRLRAISGAETPEQVVEYWQGLQAKEARMHDLVALAEKREAACKEEISALLASRSTMYESRPSSSSQATKAAAVVAAAAAAEAESAGEAAGEEQELQQDEEDEEAVEAAAAKIEEAEKRMEAVQGQFNKLRGICVAAEQGMRSLAQRLSLALEAPVTVGPSAQQASLLEAGQSSACQQPGAPGSRLTSAGGVSSISGGHGDGMRRSAAGSTGSAGHHRRPSRDHGLDAVAQQAALASKAHRLNSSRARGHPDSASSAGAGGLAFVPEDAAGSRPRGSQDSGAIAASSSRPVLPSRGRNTIDDDSFFEGLPQLLTEVTDKLEKLMSAGQGLDLSAIAAAAAQAGVLGSGYSSAVSTARRRSGGSADVTPRGAAIRSMQAGLLPVAVENLRASTDAAKAAAAATDAARASQASSGDVASSRASADASASRASQASEGGAAAGAPAAEADPAATQTGAAAGEAATPAAEEGAEPAAAGEAAEGAPAAAAAAADGDEGEQAAAAADDASAQPATAEEGQAAGEESQAAEQGAAGATDTSTHEEPAADAPAAAEQPPAAEVKPAAAPAADQPAAAAAAAAVAPVSAAVTPGSFIATQSPCVTAARSSAASSILLNEKALLKGLHRRTWVGAPWMDAVSDNPLDMNLVPSMKRKKGKKKEAAAGPDLNRILGYIPPGDVPAESDSDGDADGLGEAGPGADGVVDREYIKMRAAKITARHNAKAAAAAAAQSLQGR